MDARVKRRSVIAAMAAGMLLPPVAWSAPRSLQLRTKEGREIAVSHWRPKGRRRGVILFSHGAASAPWKYERLIQPWADRGWEVFAPLHVDSTDHPDTKSYPGMKSWAARVEDMHLLARRYGRGGYVAAGHSYGGLTALTLGGAAAAVPEGYQGQLRDPAARCVLAFSPPPPLPGLISEAGYAKLAVPALIQTGTQDMWPAAPPGPDAWRGHLVAYKAAEAGGDRYALVLEGVDHYFRGAICRPELPGPPQLPELAQAVELSLRFMDAHHRRDATARRALIAAVNDTGPVLLQRK
ncbi:MAG: alpha/beta hydrolase [Alphaproteobacteria bacterium HGW-Alphaproteobacteria-16]|nr:MAG: alpha/beta hydrolase [Alphaproteobacteria bacterium HGW-Alphaproteobacteria-16]